MKLCKPTKNTILWVTSLAEPCFNGYVQLVVEDKNGHVVTVELYNQVSRYLSHEDLVKKFPVGVQIGIK